MPQSFGIKPNYGRADRNLCLQVPHYGHLFGSLELPPLNLGCVEELTHRRHRIHNCFSHLRCTRLCRDGTYLWWMGPQLAIRYRISMPTPTQGSRSPLSSRRVKLVPPQFVRSSSARHIKPLFLFIMKDGARCQ